MFSDDVSSDCPDASVTSSVDIRIRNVVRSKVNDFVSNIVNSLIFYHHLLYSRNNSVDVIGLLCSKGSIV